MSLEKFYVDVIVKHKCVKPENGYIVLHDEDEYVLSISNDDKIYDCDAEVKINNVLIKTICVDKDRSDIIGRHFKLNVEEDHEDLHYDVISVIFKPRNELDENVTIDVYLTSIKNKHIILDDNNIAEP
jgi:hypothetical protein